jgi:hypothetical protein
MIDSAAGPKYAHISGIQTTFYHNFDEFIRKGDTRTKTSIKPSLRSRLNEMIINI